MAEHKINLIFWFLVFLFFYSCEHRENTYSKESSVIEIQNEAKFPSENSVYKDFEEILSEDETITSVHTSFKKNLIYILGSFTGKSKKECLTILPEIYPKGRIYSNPILLYKYNEKGWNYGGWNNLYSNVEADTIELFDLNQDSISEFVLKYDIVGTGIYGQQLELVSLKDNNQKILYGNESLDFSESRDRKSWSKGDTIFERVNFEIKYEGQHIPAVIEHKTIGLFRNLVKDSLIVDERKTSRKIRLSFE